MSIIIIIIKLTTAHYEIWVWVIFYRLCSVTFSAYKVLVTVVLVINYNISVLFFAADIEDTEKNADKYDESVDEDNFTPFSKHISVIDNTQVSAVDRGFKPQSGQTKDYKIGICCFSAQHAALRRKSKDLVGSESG